jgi:hypothetical protein
MMMPQVKVGEDNKQLNHRNLVKKMVEKLSWVVKNKKKKKRKKDFFEII